MFCEAYFQLLDTPCRILTHQHLANMRTEFCGASRHHEAKTLISLNRRLSWLDSLIARHLALTLMLFAIVGGASGADVSLFKVITGAEHARDDPQTQGLTSSYTLSPTYREEQLIISQPGNTTVISWQQHNYTSLFDKGFLHQLLDLQKAIREISVPYNGLRITLGDICFSPPEYDCTVLSILNYYQNYGVNLDKEVMDEYGWWVLANYLNHLEYCVVMPTSAEDRRLENMSCRGTFGGPVLPRTIFEGYTGYRYGSSTAFVITFLVNNYKDPLLNEAAEAWESKFEQFMTEYINTHNNLHIVVSSGV